MPTLPDDFDMQKQEGCNWCWLATAASVADLHKGRPGQTSQCALAQHLVPNLPQNTQCCNGGKPPFDCDKAGLPFDSLNAVSHYDGQQQGLASFQAIEAAIARDNPVVVRLQYVSSRTSHVVAVKETFLDDAGAEMLVVVDPDQAREFDVEHGAVKYRRQPVAWQQTYFTRP